MRATLCLCLAATLLFGGHLGQAKAAQTIFDPATDCARLPEGPVARLKVPPRYPRDQLEAEADGWVFMLFGVNEAGRLYASNVLDAIGAPSFRDAAREALLQWRYEPWTPNGRPEPFHGVVVDMAFRIHNGNGSPPELIEALALAKSGD